MRKSIFVVAALFVFVLGGCSWFAAAPAGSITLVDDFDRTIELAGPARKIVSLVPSSTEIIYALGVGDRLVGASKYCNYPEEALAVTRVADFDAPNLELIVSMEPDLVLAASLHKDTVEALAALDIPVLALDPMTIEEIYANIELVALAVGEEAAGADLIQDMKDRLSAVEQALADLDEDQLPIVFYEVWHSVSGVSTAGEDTFIGEMITLAGGKNMAWGISRWETIQEEEVLERNPDFIIHGHSHMDTQDFAQREGWAGIKAVQEEKIYFVNPDITSRTGPRVVDAVEEMARLFHPDRF